MSGSKSWNLTKKDEQKLDYIREEATEENIWKAIENEECWFKYNYQLWHFHNAAEIVKTVKLWRLRWLGHKQDISMSET
jgi:hypothetical protein